MRSSGRYYAYPNLHHLPSKLRPAAGETERERERALEAEHLLFFFWLFSAASPEWCGVPFH